MRMSRYFPLLLIFPAAALAASAASGQDSLSSPSSESASVTEARPVLDRHAALTFAPVIGAVPRRVEEQDTILERMSGGSERVARFVGSAVGDFFRRRRSIEEQRRLAEAFYGRFWAFVIPMKLPETETQELLRRVESFYLEEERLGSSRYDMLTFREMPDIIRMVRADMLLETAGDGQYETFYPDGRIRERWQYAGGKPHGVMMAFGPDGEVRQVDHYERGFLVKRFRYGMDGTLESVREYPVSAVPAPPAEESVPPAVS